MIDPETRIVGGHIEKMEEIQTIKHPLSEHDAAAMAEMTVDDVVAQVEKIKDIVKRVMKQGEHYGVIPGTTKPTLFKPGAEKLGLVFRLSPSYDIHRDDLPNGHREYQVVCVLTHIPTGIIVGCGLGLCSTMESKYRYRNSERTCPSCSEPSIRRSKQEYGGGWYCNAKAGGCNAKFAAGDESIESQTPGKIENPDIADVLNTVFKIAKKRAHSDAILTATAASDQFEPGDGDGGRHQNGSDAPESNAGAPGDQSPPRDRGTPPPRATAKDLIRFEHLGSELYGENWTAEKRTKLINYVTKQRTGIPRELRQVEVIQLNKGLEAQLAGPPA